MIVRWPGKISASSKTDHVSTFWDVFPTFNDIVGTEQPKNLDGVSFLPTLFEKESDQKQHEYLYWEFHEKGGRQAVRKGNWKAVKYNVLKDPGAPIELYNLLEDIGEENNIASKHHNILLEMEKILKEARTPSDVFTFGQDTYLSSE